MYKEKWEIERINAWMDGFKGAQPFRYNNIQLDGLELSCIYRYFT